jgi:hypothetical protein
MRRILATNARRPGAASTVAGSTTYAVPQDTLARNNMYVACFVDEDLQHLVTYTGEDQLLMGSAFVHQDHGTELDFIGGLNERVKLGEISEALVKKITYDNPRTFYAL